MKNYSLFGLPEIKFCKLCVMSNQKPNAVVELKNIDNKKEGMHINADGVCSACEYSVIKESKINWKEREEQLQDILSKYRKSSGFDCVVPSSGGKDSSYVAHILKYKYKMNPLSVTWAPHIYTDIGWKNFQSHINVGGVDNILFTPNGKLHRYLTKIAFLNLLHPFQPFIIGQKSVGPKIAAKFDIPLVVYGENTAEYGKSIEENFDPLMPASYYASNSKDIYIGKKSIKEIVSETDYDFKDFTSYMPIDINEANKKKIKVFHLGYFHKWDPQEMYYYASENTGFRANSERTQGSYSKYSSIDDKIDSFHYYTMFIKFGIGRASFDASQELRNNKITREEAINLVKKYDGEFPNKHFKDFIEYIGIDEKEFWKTIDSFRSPHLWGKKNGEWSLKKAIYKL